MDTNTAKKMLTTALRARTPVVAIESPEETRVLTAIQEVASEPTTNVAGAVLVQSRLVFRWTCTDGVVQLAGWPAGYQPQHGTPDFLGAVEDPSEALRAYCDWVSAKDIAVDDAAPAAQKADQAKRKAAAVDERASILVLCDIHRFTNSQESGGRSDLFVLRRLRDTFATLRRTKSMAILLGPYFDKLGDADRDIFKMTWPLPSLGELAKMVQDSAKAVEGRVPVHLNGDTEVLARALSALTYTEAMTTLSMAIVEAGALSVDACADLILSTKSEILRKQRGLTLIQPTDGLDDIAGLELLKGEMAGLPRLLTQEAKALKVKPPRAILLAGPPGTGKTLSAKVMGSAANLPVLIWSIGETHSKFVGESAHNTRDVLTAADAINNCILVIDEGDTQLSEGGAGDSKAHDEVLGMVLTWLQEKTSDVVVVVTTNHPERLRHAILERCDRKWFVDYPDLLGCGQVIRIHLRKRGLSLSETAIDKLAGIAAEKHLAGRNIEDSVDAAHRTAFMAGRQMTAQDLEAVLIRAKGLWLQRPEEAQAIRSWCADHCEAATAAKPDMAVLPKAQVSTGVADLEL